MLIELHAHTSRHSSCSILDPIELIRRAISKKLQGVLITEHHYLWTQGEIEQLRRDSGAENYFIILAAQEVASDIGHIIVIGAHETIKEGTALSEIKKKYPNTAIILAHPFRSKNSIPPDNKLINKQIDAVEIFNSNQTMRENALALAAWHRLKFNALAGSDAHSPDTVGIYPSLFDHHINSIDDLIVEIKNFRARPFYKEIPKAGGNTTVTEITFGTKGEDEYRRRIILRSFASNNSNNNIEKKFQKSAESARQMIKIREKGFSDGIYRVPDIIDIQSDEKIIIEEGQRGKSLYETMTKSSPATAKENFELAARWLARFHLAQQEGINSDTDEREKTLKREEKRLKNYLAHFETTSNPWTQQAKDLVSFAINAETKVLKSDHTPITICHGDFHPKNIIIGQDISHDVSTKFISVIDFESMILHHPCFDIGYFLAQTENQFFYHKQIRKYLNEKKFILAYLQELHRERNKISSLPTWRKMTYENLNLLIALFKIRAFLSIMSFLIKVGKGESPEVETSIKKSVSLMKKYKKEIL